MYSHLLKRSPNEEASPANAWMSVLRDSVKCLFCVKELLNFQYDIPRTNTKVGQSFNTIFLIYNWLGCLHGKNIKPKVYTKDRGTYIFCIGSPTSH